MTRENDGSLYIIPFSLHGKYRGKVARLGNASGPFETEIDYSDTEVSLDRGSPHISIHQSGLVRAYINRGTFFGELQSVPPTLLVNQHIASLSMDSFESLPELTEDIHQDDVVQKVDPGVQGLRFPIYVNSQHRAFLTPCVVQFDLARPTLAKNIHYCVSFKHDQPKITKTLEHEQDIKGITVIAGWDVWKMDAGEESDFSNASR